MSWEKQARPAESEKSVDLESNLVGHALNLMADREGHKACPGSNHSMWLPPELDNKCIANLPDYEKASPSQSNVDLCVAMMPRSGDPPRKVDLCVAMMPRSGDPDEVRPKDYDLCVSILPEVPHGVNGCVDKIPYPHEIGPKGDELCVARLPQPGDPPVIVDLCVAKMPRHGDPPVIVDLCVAKMPQHGDPPPKYDLCVSTLPETWRNVRD